jgi:glutaredoxin-related protein
MNKSLFEDIRIAKQGMFDPSKRYAVKNITGDVFAFRWNGVDIEMKADETIEIPQYLAYNAVNKMIDQMIQGEQTKELMKIRETNPSFIQVNGAGKMGVPAFRLTYENRIVKELSPKVGNDAKLDIIRLREQVEADIKRSQEDVKPIESVKVAPTEFAGLIDHSAAIL